jgi:hypothetical protein
VPTKRRKLPHKRIDAPAWAVRLLAGERPVAGTPDFDGYFGWLFCGDQVAGLPDPMSPEGWPLWKGPDAD